MRRRSSLRVLLTGAAAFLASACLFVSASRADDAETPDSLLQEAAKQAGYCKPPKPDWPKKKLSSNFDSCSDAAQTFVKAIEVSKKDTKIVGTASSPLMAATMNRAASALYIGRIYTEGASPEAALGFFRVACGSFDAVSSFGKPTPEQDKAMQTVVADTEQALQGYHRTCKTVATPEGE